jgi:hypothetical protein
LAGPLPIPPNAQPPMPPGGIGAASQPSPMPGAAAQGTNLVRMGLEALQKALPAIPLGSPLHTAVMKSVTELSKQVGQIAGANDPSALIQQLAAAARSQQTQPVPPALAGGGAPPGAAPAAPMPHPPMAA